MEKIKTATGKELDCSYVTTMRDPDQAYIRICGRSLAEVAAVFSDPAETMQLWFGETYLAQYTRLIALIPEDGCIRVCLAKE